MAQYIHQYVYREGRYYLSLLSHTCVLCTVAGSLGEVDHVSMAVESQVLGTRLALNSEQTEKKSAER